MSVQTSTQKNYFDLHVLGLGYLNRIRLVEPKKGKPFYACQIAALVGESNKPEYRYFDCSITSETAEKLVVRCIDAVKEKRKVLVNFVLGDIWTDTFTYSDDNKFHKKGDVGVSLKARLIRIKSVRVDGELKYSEPVKAQAASNDEADAQANSETQA